MKIPLVNLERMHRPIREEIDESIRQVVDHHHFINGEEVGEFEKAFSQYLGVRHVLGAASGTDALLMALKACGVGKGDWVVTVPNTFIATTEAISLAGAEIRFVDVDPQTSNMDAQKLEAWMAALSGKDRERLKAILFVNLYGNPAGLEAVARIARERKLRLVSDAAQAHGATISGRSITDFADVTTYSFFPGKNLGAFGDAGAVATNHDGMAHMVSRWRNHGRTGKYIHQMEAFNCRLDTLQAAVLAVKLRSLATWNERRIEAAGWYNSLLGERGFWTPQTQGPAHSVFHLYVTRTKRRHRVIRKLADAGIAAGIHYPVPLHLQPAYRRLGHRRGDFPITEALAREIISLPIDGTITEPEVHAVAGHFLETAAVPDLRH